MAAMAAFLDIGPVSKLEQTAHRLSPMHFEDLIEFAMQIYETHGDWPEAVEARRAAAARSSGLVACDHRVRALLLAARIDEKAMDRVADEIVAMVPTSDPTCRTW